MIQVYPGNSNFIKLAKILNIPYKTTKKINGEHLVTEFYIFTIQDFKWLEVCFKTNIEKKRKEFYSQPDLIQLVKILKYIYKRNNDAKKVNKYFFSVYAYDDKSLFLKMALEIATKVVNPNFSYGVQKDPYNSYHHYIYYFQIGKDQISFHSEKRFENVPDFKGEWTGIINEYFPFNLKEIKKK